jgi:predicted membrane channel-forming protein YqfA (hemolysin III family)
MKVNIRLGFTQAQVLMLVAIQVVSTVLLWVLNPVSQQSTDTFALFLSVDLMAFVLISYIYRVKKEGRPPSQTWTAIGYLTIVVLLASDLVLASS